MFPGSSEVPAVSYARNTDSPNGSITSSNGMTEEGATATSSLGGSRTSSPEDLGGLNPCIVPSPAPDSDSARSSTSTSTSTSSGSSALSDWTDSSISTTSKDIPDYLKVIDQSIEGVLNNYRDQLEVFFLNDHLEEEKQKVQKIDDEAITELKNLGISNESAKKLIAGRFKEVKEYLFGSNANIHSEEAKEEEEREVPEILPSNELKQIRKKITEQTREEREGLIDQGLNPYTDVVITHKTVLVSCDPSFGVENSTSKEKVSKTSKDLSDGPSFGVENSTSKEKVPKTSKDLSDGPSFGVENSTSKEKVSKTSKDLFELFLGTPPGSLPMVLQSNNPVQSSPTTDTGTIYPVLVPPQPVPVTPAPPPAQDKQKLEARNLHHAGDIRPTAPRRLQNQDPPPPRRVSSVKELSVSRTTKAQRLRDEEVKRSIRAREEAAAKDKAFRESAVKPVSGARTAVARPAATTGNFYSQPGNARSADAAKKPLVPDPIGARRYAPPPPAKKRWS